MINNSRFVKPFFFSLFIQRILTTEWIDGCKINDTACLKKQKLDLVDVDKKLFAIMAEQIFHTGFIHADPHPGNSKMTPNLTNFRPKSFYPFNRNCIITNFLIQFS